MGNETQEWLNASGTLELLGHNAELYDTVLSMFADDLVQKSRLLDQVWHSEERAGLGALLHTLKGVCATAGALELARRCQALEPRVASSDFSQTRADFDELMQGVQATLDAVSRYRKARAPAEPPRAP